MSDGKPPTPITPGCRIFLPSRSFFYLLLPGACMARCSARKELRHPFACLSFGERYSAATGMTNYDAAPSDRGMSEEESIHLALPGLLRENQNLDLNPAIRTALLFYNEPNGEARVVTEHQFSPSGMCVLIPLLQAYPNYCPYEVLLAHLYPISVEAGRTQLQEARETTIRPVRRAIGTIMDGLHQFGLRACSIRSLGYVLQRLE